MTDCRSCDFASLEPVVSLGSIPLANALLDPGADSSSEKRYPLDLVFCPNCALVQITETIPREEIFRDYPYFSSYSDTMGAHARALAERLVREEGLGPQSLVIEPASNDGYLLKHFASLGVSVLGVDPAKNVAKVARDAGIPTVSEFFGPALAPSLPKADLVVANNVLAHTDDLNGFVSSVGSVLKPDGLAVLEVPYVKDMVDRCEFDTVYHEHLCYFSVTSLDALFARNGLFLDHAERIALHGGSLLLRARRDPRRRASVEALLHEEASWGVRTRGYYRMMAHRMVGMREALSSLLKDLKAEGRAIAAYGASAKGSTLLNSFGIGRETLDFVADRNPHKHGKLLPGVRIPIVPAESLSLEMPAYTLLLAWNFAEEILSQQETYRRRGGKFILYVPDLRVL